MLYENLHFKAPKLNTSSSDLGVDNMFWQHDNNITDDEHHTILINKFSQLEENEIMTTIDNKLYFQFPKKCSKPDRLYVVCAIQKCGMHF